jgi:hypothetical protein
MRRNERGDGSVFLMRKLILLAAVAVGAVVLVVLLRTGRTGRLDVSREAEHSDEAQLFLNYWRTNPVLERLSATNAAFQAWGKVFMLQLANDHLSKVPLYGLKGPLRAEDVSVQSRLTTAGAEMYLKTLDGRHEISFFRGVVNKAVAWDVEMTEIFRNPSVFEHLRDHTGPWSVAEARKAAEALVKAKGLDIKRMDGRATPVVRPDTFNLEMPDGSVKPVTVFYTVRWLDAEVDDADAVEIRFRRTVAGDWAVTQWFQAPAGGSESEATDFGKLYNRFFAGR